MEKNYLLDWHKLSNAVSVLIVVFIAQQIFFGSWKKSHKNSENILRIEKQVEKTIVNNKHLSKSFDNFMKDQKKYNSKLANKLDSKLDELRELLIKTHTH